MDSKTPARSLPLIHDTPVRADAPASDSDAAAAADPGPEPDVRALLDGDTFCVKPWMHCHVTATGDVRPCCVSPVRYGSLREEPLRALWQNQAIREFRMAHLSGKKVSGCERCYDDESVGAYSIRKDANNHFGERVRPWVQTTTASGHARLARPVDYDIRFSNICNFKCRSCHYGSSSSWYTDHVALHGKPEDGSRAIIRAFDHAGEFWAAFDTFADDCERLYFAGGEPLLQEEHYEILRALHDRGRHDVAIFYNTNFSTLDYRDHRVTDLWRHFHNLMIGASLDASGARGELMRHGLSWSQVLRNRERLRQESPAAKLRVACTVSALNVWHLPDFHRELIDAHFIQPEEFDINIAHYPPMNSAQVLPTPLKREIETRLNLHIAWLVERGEHVVANRFSAVREFMLAKDNSSELDEFRSYCRALDELRSEDTPTVFPELATVFEQNGS